MSFAARVSQVLHFALQKNRPYSISMTNGSSNRTSMKTKMSYKFFITLVELFSKSLKFSECAYSSLCIPITFSSDSINYSTGMNWKSEICTIVSKVLKTLEGIMTLLSA